jgi:ABC-type polysaccharide/polyol phosphate transport system ATPase subunit
VDEVLSVGDYQFEHKCFARIRDFRAQGGAVLFVSHSMPAVKHIADRVVWLHKGLVRKIGSPDEIIPEYESTPMETDAP